MKELKEFTVERLEELSRFKTNHELALLAKIALAAKQAKPVAWTSQSNLDAVALEIPNNLEFMSGDKGVYKKPVPLYTTPPLNHTEQHMVVPDGWKLVPIEPDYEMKKHYHDASVAPISKLSVTGYRAMLAAAPKPESE